MYKISYVFIVLLVNIFVYTVSVLSKSNRTKKVYSSALHLKTPNGQILINDIHGHKNVLSCPGPSKTTHIRPKTPDIETEQDVDIVAEKCQIYR